MCLLSSLAEFVGAMISWMVSRVGGTGVLWLNSSKPLNGVVCLQLFGVVALKLSL